MPQPRHLIRKNPQVADPQPPTEWCPEHGTYPRPAEALYLLREATTESVEPGKARAMLDRVAQLKRRCPECHGPAPSPLEWATRIRESLQPQTLTFVMPPRRIADPDAEVA